MAALVVPGAPVSVLLDHGLPEGASEALLAAGVATVESLGSMTPEELETVPGITPEMVEPIQAAVNGYYGQFESSVEPAAAPAVEAAPGEAAPAAESGGEAVPAAVEAVVAEDPEGESATIRNAE